MVKINVTPVNSTEIAVLPNSWNLEDYKKLIDEFGDEPASVSEQEVQEYLYMMIADNEVPESAAIILKYVMNGELSDGQIQNLSNEMEEDKMWEEYSDMRFHKKIFRANQLLFDAYNGKVPKGEAMEIEFRVGSKSSEILDVIENKSTDAIFRILMAGSDSHAIVHRLYDDEAKAGQIKDAEFILWEVSTVRNSPSEVMVKVISSEYWFSDYIADKQYEVTLDPEIYEVK